MDLGAIAVQTKKNIWKTVYYEKSKQLARWVRKKFQVQTFVADTKSNVIDANTTVRKFNITEKQVYKSVNMLAWLHHIKNKSMDK